MIVKAIQTIRSQQSKRIFESVIVVAFQNIFHSEMLLTSAYQNNLKTPNKY
jgi:hypothetical protein